MLLKACLNGSRAAGDHPALPLTPEALAQAAHGAVAAGAGALHVHPRDQDGAETLAGAAVGAALTAIRLACPAVPVGVSTGAWIVPNPAQRLELVRSWTVLPDFASVNLAEQGAGELCAVLLGLGVAVEAGLATPQDAQRLLALGLAGRCLRLLIEPAEQALDAALSTTAAIVAVLDQAGERSPRLLHGYDATTWPLLDAACQREYALRIGLEDTLTLPNGQPARDNAQLVATARARALRHDQVV